MSRLAAVAMGTIVAVGLLEVVLRFWSPVRTTVRAGEIVLPIYKHVERTHQRPHSKLDAHIVARYNGLGFRGPPPPRDFDEALTIVTVGGSTTACSALSDGKTWPDRLAQHLEDDLDDIWVNNAGFDGHTTFGHRQLLDEALAALRPDYVLYMVGINDIGRHAPRDPDRSLSPTSDRLRDVLRRSELAFTMEALLRTLWARRLGLTHVEIDYAHVPAFREPPATWAATLRVHEDVHLPAYRTRLRALLRATRDAGIEPILVTQTLLAGEVTDPTTGVFLGDRAFKADLSTSMADELLGLYNDATRRLGASEGVHVIDLAADFPKDSALYYDWMHYTNRGAALVAERLAAGLVPILREPSPG